MNRRECDDAVGAIFSVEDADRVVRTLATLQRHGLDSMVLTGGLAVELHLRMRGLRSEPRPLNDIDFVVNSFDDIPATLGADLLLRHVHPHDPPAKTLLQCVHPQTAVRVDIFRGYSVNLGRAIQLNICDTTVRLIGLEDLAARTARLCMALAAGEPVPAKHANDLLRLLPCVDLEHAELAWQGHRKVNHPATFAATVGLLTKLIATRPDLQIVPVYSQDTNARCPRCKATEAFPLADANLVLSLLGYC